MRLIDHFDGQPLTEIQRAALEDAQEAIYACAKAASNVRSALPLVKSTLAEAYLRKALWEIEPRPAATCETESKANNNSPQRELGQKD